MQKLSIAIEERPEESEAEKQQRRPRQNVAQRRSADPDGQIVRADHPHLPCLHWQGSTSVAPAAYEVGAQNQEQV
jgi:hypothetical protein